jgi:hypothetical protein
MAQQVQILKNAKNAKRPLQSTAAVVPNWMAASPAGDVHVYHGVYF